MKKFLLFIVTILSLYSCTNDEAPIFGDIYGVVSDVNSGAPIRNAEVILSPGNKAIVTGGDGHFEFNNLEAGQYKISVNAEDYESNNAQITVVPGNKVSCDIHLTPKPVTEIFRISAKNLNFGTTQTQMSIEVTNDSASEAVWSLDLGNNNWIKASPISGRLAAGKTESILFTCNRSTVTTDKSGIVRISALDSTTPINVSCSPSAQVSSIMEVTPLDIDFEEQSVEQIVRIKNISDANLNWTIYNVEEELLSVSDASGVIQPGNGKVVALKLNRSKMKSDIVTSFIISDGATEQQVNVYAQYSEDYNYSKGYITLSSNELDFGVDNSELTITLANIGNEVAEWVISDIQHPSIVSCVPTSGAIEPDKDAKVIVAIARENMTESLESSFIISDGVNSYIVNVTALVMDEVAGSKRIYYTSKNGEVVAPNDATAFGSEIISNTYENGKGIIVFTDPVTEIGAGAFLECSDLTSVTLPNTVVSIGAGAFAECSSLTSINIPDGVTSIAEELFVNCSALSTINIPASVTSIGDQAFANCKAIKNISLTDGVSTIGAEAFLACVGITNINLPKNIKTIGCSAFAGCTGLTSVSVPANAANWESSVFANCTSITSVNLANDITLIPESMFSGCTSLAGITIPKSVKTVGANAFSGCVSLNTLTISDGVAAIEDMAFNNCRSIKSIIIPQSITSIGVSSFADCGSLIEVVCKPTTPPTLGGGAFNGISAECKIYVPEGTYASYIVADVWVDSISMPVIDCLGDEFLEYVKDGMTVTIKEGGVVEVE